MQEKDVFDVTIIGGGPTGMFASFYAGMRELKVKIIETLPVLGGQIEVMYPEKVIFDIGAFPFIKGKELIERLHQQMEPFDIEICLDESVVNIEKKDDLFILKTTEGIHYSKTILLTTGQGSFEPRKLTFDYNEEYEHSNLHYYVKPLATYEDKTVVICGGGDSAVDWALTLEKIAKKVTIVHRRDKFRAYEKPVTLLKESSAEILTPYVPIELIGDEKKLHEVVFRETRGEKEVSLPADYFIVNFGFVSDNRRLTEWGLETIHSKAVVSQRMETNIPGIFAAGDVATFEGKVNLIATGFGEAPTAINSIIQYLNPDQYIQAPMSADPSMADKFKGHLTEDSHN